MADYSKLCDKEKLEVIKQAMKSYPDFPKPGIIFKDIFSVLYDPPVFALLKEQIIKKVKEIQPPVELVVALDARGFLFGPLIALELQIPFAPIRKRGKLPGKIKAQKYSLEYGEDIIEIQESAVKPGQNVLLVDDLLATGGTLKAACEMIKSLGGIVGKCLVIMELVDLKGRDTLPVDVITLIET